MALRMSCVVHGVLLVLLMGCAAHRRPVAAVAIANPKLDDADEFIGTVARKMPMWDADDISRYERAEIATVKADIALARQDEATGAFLEDVSKLRNDWDVLVALDEMLKKESLT
jgi:hypothetical protein